MLVVKKYSNRRLYDTEQSRYITQGELAATIRAGRDVRVVDAKTDADLTQETLLQMVLEGPSAHLLPVPLLQQLVRMGDDALADFFGRWMTWSLEAYFAMRQRAQSSWNPFASMPFDVGNALARLLVGQQAPTGAPLPPPPSPQVAESPDVAELRRELDELKRQVKVKKRRR